MTLSNQERADRCRDAIRAFSIDDDFTSLVDFLANAMHWCKITGHSFPDALDAARLHFEAKLNGDDITDDLNRETLNERKQP